MRRGGRELEGIDSNFHPSLGVAWRGAYEEAVSCWEHDLIIAWIEHFGASWSYTASITPLVHCHHVVNCGVIVESYQKKKKKKVCIRFVYY